MDVGSKHSIGWNYSRHAPSWSYYLHCRINETSSRGSICILCHQVLRHASEHGTSSKGNHWLAKGHIAMLNQLPELEVTELTSLTVNETALAQLQQQRSRGIRIVSLQSKFIFHI